MKRAIAIHRTDFIAIISLVVIALAVVIYILEHQPSFTLDKTYYTVYAQFQTGAAVTAGQGQTVDIAGVEVGQVGGVKLENGRAVVTMNIFKKYRPIYKDASVLLRPRTPLKDMYLALDPGTPTAGEVPNGGMLSASATSPDVNVDQILAVAGHRHPQLPAAAAFGRRRCIPEPRGKGRGAQPQRGARPAGRVQALCAPEPRDADVHPAAGAAPAQHQALDPQPGGRDQVAGQRQRPAHVADQVLEHQLLGDLLAGRQPAAGADAVAGDPPADLDDAWARSRRSRTRARPRCTR